MHEEQQQRTTFDSGAEIDHQSVHLSDFGLALRISFRISGPGVVKPLNKRPVDALTEPRAYDSTDNKLVPDKDGVGKRIGYGRIARPPLALWTRSNDDQT